MNRYVYKFITERNWSIFLNKNGLNIVNKYHADPNEQLKYLRTFYEHRDLHYELYNKHFSYFKQVSDTFTRKYSKENEKVLLLTVDPNGFKITNTFNNKNGQQYPHLLCKYIPINEQEKFNNIPTIKYIRKL